MATENHPWTVRIAGETAARSISAAYSYVHDGVFELKAYDGEIVFVAPLGQIISAERVTEPKPAGGPPPHPQLP